jgi:ABC-type phosphate transport system ATPase subunit
MRDNVNTTRKNTETLTDACEEVKLKVVIQKSEYTLILYHQNTGKNCHIQTANRFFETMAHFRYLGTTVRNKNLIHEEIKSSFIRVMLVTLSPEPSDYSSAL